MKTNLKNLYIKAAFVSFLCAFNIQLSAQEQIHLNNPSFEDDPADATVPHAWFACADGSTPDILPGFWGVYDEANDGETYVGLITRENSTYESIGQRLNQSLSKKYCYEMSLDLAKADNYTGYSKALKLRIWISTTKCEKEQLIFESDPIKKAEWETFKLQFVPEIDAKYIKIEAFIKEGSFNHKGNILIDNITPIISCERV